MSDGAMAPDAVPPFFSRLQLILQQLLKYSHMYPLREDLESLAHSVLTSSLA
jgi:hypothetical protein